MRVMEAEPGLSAIERRCRSGRLPFVWETGEPARGRRSPAKRGDISGLFRLPQAPGAGSTGTRRDDPENLFRMNDNIAPVE